MDFLSTVIFDNTILAWLVVAAVSGVLFLLFYVARRVLIKRAGKLAAKTATDLDDFLLEILGEVRNYFLLALAILLGTRPLTLPENVNVVIRVTFVTLALMQCGFLAIRLMNYLLGKREAKQGASQSAMLKTLGRLLTGVIWALVIVMALESIPGVEVSTLVTTLGVTGIAVAFAVQNILSDLFAALSITFDQPFIIGDFIVVDDMLGTVEHIGLRSTRVRSLSGELLVFSNTDLLDSRIRNYQKLERRRVVLEFGVTYQTTHEKLEAIPAMVAAVIDGREKVSFDRAHFTGFGDSALDYEVVYYVESSDYVLFMDVQQAIGLELLKRFEAEGIEFAYPTQTVFVEQN